MLLITTFYLLIHLFTRQGQVNQKWLRDVLILSRIDRCNFIVCHTAAAVTCMRVPKNVIKRNKVFKNK